MGALEGAMETLRIMKLNMVDTGAPNHVVKWAIGSTITTLVSNLLRICDEVIGDSIEASRNEVEVDANTDLRKIKAEFNDFIDKMLGNN